MIKTLLRYLKAPFTEHRYLFDEAECTSIEPGINPSQAFLSFVAECKYCPKKIKVDYDKVHGLIPVLEKFGCVRSRQNPPPKPTMPQFAEREMTQERIDALKDLPYTPFEKETI